MKEQVISSLKKITNLSECDLDRILEIPKDKNLGDFAFPCFFLAKTMKKNPVQIAQELSNTIDKKNFEKVEAKGAYLNFFLKKANLAKEVLTKVLKEKSKFGSSNLGNGKKIVIDLSAPNIAKPFGIGHLRSTIIGNSIAETAKFIGFKVIKINYLGDWGTQFGKLILGYKKWGNEKELKKNPILHLQELYVRVNKSEEFEEESREEFKKLEEGDKENLKLWKKFRELSLVEFNRIYDILNVKFDITSGESEYNHKMDTVIKMLKEKRLLKESDGAQVVDLDKYNLGVCLLKKSDGATLYATRDITAAIDRYNRFKFDQMIYEVGAEQKLHFKQFFKVLELSGHSWAKECVHVSHGLYLDSDGKKFSTRKGKTVYMSDILDETINLAKKEIEKREKISKTEIDKRAKAIALSAIVYGDLKNYRENDAIFDIDRFISFEGNTGPYILYAYARANSILAKKKAPIKFEIPELDEASKQLVLRLN